MAKKYVDVERLKAEIEKRLKNVRDYMTGVGMRYKGPKYYKMQGKESAYDALLNIIGSFQQEQESVAERFARIVRGNLIGIDKEVQQKFEQLYFEVTGNKMYGGYND